MSSPADRFPTDTAGLAPSGPPVVVELADGDVFDLRIAPVTKQIGDATVRMLAYNNSVPGPTLKVREGSEVIVNVENQGDLETTVHWHGLRLDNRYDGTHVSKRRSRSVSALITACSSPIRARTGITRSADRLDLRVDEHVRVAALQRTLAERLDLLIQQPGDPADLAA